MNCGLYPGANLRFIIIVFAPLIPLLSSKRAPLPVLIVAVLFAGVHGGRSQNDYKRFFDEQNLPAVHEMLAAGKYDLVQRLCEYAQSRGQPSPDWEVMQWVSMAAQGQVAEAFSLGRKRLGTKTGEDLTALMALHQLAKQLGEDEAAADILKKVNEVAIAQGREERSAADLVALGKAAVALGADPGKAIKQYFEPAKKKKSAPKFQNKTPYDVVAAYQAIGDLALEKSDYAKAAREFSAGLKLAPNDPGLRFGMAQAFYPDDQKKALQHLERTLQINPVHEGALLLLAQHALGAENYVQAESHLDRILSVNESSPEAWGMKAALAELASADVDSTDMYREQGLKLWQENPLVDHTIGKILTRAYRFEKGAEFQRKALAMDENYIHARLQLADDLLRLGKEEEAWKLAASVVDEDPYNVAAFNLGLLHDEMKNFVTLETTDFIVRLPANEAPIYGQHALHLLSEAKRVLCNKYNLILEEPVLVEFFPDQQDFAIRTLGNLGGAGILGACFGSVVTMNSPGGLAHERNNWEATLWHEFCHVVTLTLTKNRMPRWLSEGISVYEERQRNPVWGQSMTPEYRKLILEEEALTPISELSSAFLNPKDGEHLMFAYYESYLFVDYLVRNYGLDSLQGILKDLGEGILINDAIARHTGPLEGLELAFAEEVQELARNLGAGVDWEDPEPGEVDLASPPDVEKYAKANPDNFRVIQIHTADLLSQQRWKDAVKSALWMIELFPDYVGADNGYVMKAMAHRALDQPKEEAAVLRELAARSPEALNTYMRLIDIDMESENWEELLKNSSRVLAINPFLKQAHWARGRAWEKLGEEEVAASSYRRLLALKPVNPAEVNFRLAASLQPSNASLAKRHVLDALADAPRYRDAQKLLLNMEPSGNVKATPEPGIKVDSSEDPITPATPPQAPKKP